MLILLFFQLLSVVYLRIHLYCLINPAWSDKTTQITIEEFNLFFTKTEIASLSVVSRMKIVYKVTKTPQHLKEPYIAIIAICICR